MAYYLAGDYYRAGGGRNYAAGGLFSFIGKAAKAVGGVVGGPVGAVLRGGGSLLDRPSAITMPAVQGFQGMQLPTPTQRSRGVEAIGVSPKGTIGIRFGSSRRMNAGNAKAARRAIRRIKAVRHLLQGIERELPRRPAPRQGSRGVITRSEAARALRS